MKTARFQINKYYLQAAMALPVLGILAFTGCSSIDGTAGTPQPTTGRVTSYLEQSQEKSQADNWPREPYEWFY
jgi:hypothetical protein